MVEQHLESPPAIIRATPLVGLAYFYLPFFPCWRHPERLVLEPGNEVGSGFRYHLPRLDYLGMGTGGIRYHKRPDFRAASHGPSFSIWWYYSRIATVFEGRWAFGKFDSGDWRSRLTYKVISWVFGLHDLFLCTAQLYIQVRPASRSMLRLYESSTSTEL